MKKIIFYFFLICLNTHSTHTIDSQKTLACLTLDQKIGQLFMASCIINQHDNVALVNEKNYSTDVDNVKKLIANHYIGGVVYLGLSNPKEQIAATDAFNNSSQIPLFFAQDFERGLSQRLHNTLNFPYNMTLGAIDNDQLIYLMGKEIGRQCKIMGVHINLAPVCDVNNNPQNPIINDRSFGDNPEKVAQKAVAYIRGLQDNGIIACAKHFPGHGDVTKDSHEELPKITHDMQRLNLIELYPFKKAIAAGVKMMMSAFLEVPAIDPQSQCPAALSSTTVTQLLKNKLGFDGLVITDGLDMKGVTCCGDDAHIALRALLAGNDILICCKNIPDSIAHIKQAIQDGVFSIDELNNRVAKILALKKWAFEQHAQNADYGNLKKLFTPEAYTLKKELFCKSITLVQDQSALLPLHNPKATLITFSNDSNSRFAKTLKENMEITEYIIQSSTGSNQIDQIIDSLQHDEVIIVSLLHMERIGSLQFDANIKEKKPIKGFGINDHTISFLSKLRSTHKKIVLVVFGSPYSIPLFNTQDTIVIAYENDPCAQEAAAKVITGNLTAHGKLPVRSY